MFGELQIFFMPFFQAVRLMNWYWFCSVFSSTKVAYDIRGMSRWHLLSKKDIKNKSQECITELPVTFQRYAKGIYRTTSTAVPLLYPPHQNFRKSYCCKIYFWYKMLRWLEFLFTYLSAIFVDNIWIANWQRKVTSYGTKSHQLKPFTCLMTKSMDAWMGWIWCMRSGEIHIS